MRAGGLEFPFQVSLRRRAAKLPITEWSVRAKHQDRVLYPALCSAQCPVQNCGLRSIEADAGHSFTPFIPTIDNCCLFITPVTGRRSVVLYHTTVV